MRSSGVPQGIGVIGMRQLLGMLPGLMHLPLRVHLLLTFLCSRVSSRTTLHDVYVAPDVVFSQRSSVYRDVSVEVVLQALNVMSRLQNTVDGLDRYLGQVLQVWY